MKGKLTYTKEYKIICSILKHINLLISFCQGEKLYKIKFKSISFIMIFKTYNITNKLYSKC